MCRLYLPLNVFWLRSAFSVISRLNRLQMIKSGINSEREDYFSATWRQWSLSGLTRLFSEDSTSLPWRDNYGRFFLIERPRYLSHRLQLRGLKFGFKNVQHKMNRWKFHHLVFHVIYDKIFDFMPWRVFHFFTNILLYGSYRYGFKLLLWVDDLSGTRLAFSKVFGMKPILIVCTARTAYGTCYELINDQIIRVTLPFMPFLTTSGWGLEHIKYQINIRYSIC